MTEPTQSSTVDELSKEITNLVKEFGLDPKELLDSAAMIDKNLPVALSNAIVALSEMYPVKFSLDGAPYDQRSYWFGALSAMLYVTIAAADPELGLIKAWDTARDMARALIRMNDK
jgi:hypothetical protein